MKRVLAFDYGASSGRAILFTFANGQLDAQEIHRFENNPVTKDGTLYWDFAALQDALFTGIRKGVAAGGFDSIGIDTWGVDFGLIGKDGSIVGMPVHYRDTRTVGIPDEVFRLMPKKEIYDRTGIQFMDFNTIFQLYYLKTRQPELYLKANKFLLMPDLFAYILTGHMAAERTIASTTQLLDVRTGDWDGMLIGRLGLDQNKFPKILDSGSSYGRVSDAVCKALHCPNVPVIAVCCHDTASAIFSVPATHLNPLYLSSGTWSLLGVEQGSPILTDESFAADFTNETGFAKSIRYLKNIMGMWIINECRREWSQTKPISFSEIVDAAKGATTSCRIDVNDDAFARPCNMPQRIREYCLTRQGVAPEGIGEIARCVYESLTDKYGEVIRLLTGLTGKSYDTLYIVGGGCKNEYLSGLIASKLNLRVVSGPVEATAIGNAMVQLIALGEVAGHQAARQIIRDNFDIKEF